MTTLNMNLFLLKAIPLDKNLKRYYIGKYRHLCTHNGVDYANAKFKNLLYSLKHYKASGNLPSTGVRKNGWLKKLINYVDSQPHFVFNFLKGLTSWKGTIDVDKASTDFHSKLNKLTGNHPIPKFMNQWIYMLDLYDKGLRDLYFSYKNEKNSLFHKYCKHHSLRDWFKYWRYWQGKFNPRSFKPFTKRDRPVFPEMYRDYNLDDSSSYERDVVNLLTILQVNTDISKGSRDLIMSYLSEDIQDQFYSMMMDEWYPDYSCTDFMSGEYVGDIHYIPKAGTDYRPIAVPNRFIQSALVPAYGKLKIYVDRLENDCTLNQERWDNWIQSRVTSDSRFIGSVDLSSATENLPLDWLKPFFNDFLECTPLERSSLNLFLELSRARWNNDGYMSRWQVGQPLGSLPSFPVLALTHNIFCESLSLFEGYGHSPYRILGDDIVIASRRLYNSYIRQMGIRNIPISHNKSYHGKLTEFAGKTFVKNGIPFLTPDHNIITWQSLFDWQYATGIRVPWNLLPRNIRNKIETTRHLNGLSMSGQKLYHWAQTCSVYDRGTSYTSLPGGTTLEIYFSLPSSDEGQEYIEHTGITKFQNKIVIVNDNKCPSGSGLFRRFIQTKLPNWYRSKFRPCTTDSVFSNTIKALRESGVIGNNQ